MTEYGVVQFKDLNSPIGCLSAMRALHNCQRCDKYIRAETKGQINQLDCGPQIKQEYQTALTELETVRTEIQRLENQRTALFAKLGRLTDPEQQEIQAQRRRAIFGV